MSTIEFVNTLDDPKIHDLPQPRPGRYRCHLAISREDDGRFSVVILNLPGSGSCGDSEEEAIANAKEAIVGVIQSYSSDGQDVPWVDPVSYTIPDGAKQKWILVNA